MVTGEAARLVAGVKTALRARVFDLDRAPYDAWLDGAEAAVRELQEEYGDWLSARLEGSEPDAAMEGWPEVAG